MIQTVKFKALLTELKFYEKHVVSLDELVPYKTTAEVFIFPQF